MLRGRIDRHAPSRTIEPDPAGEHLADRLGVKRAGLLDGCLPKLDQAPGRLHRIAEDPVLAELTAEAGHPGGIGRRVDGLEIARQEPVASRIGGRHVSQVVLREARRHHGDLRPIDPGPGQRANRAMFAAPLTVLRMQSAPLSTIRATTGAKSTWSKGKYSSPAIVASLRASHFRTMKFVVRG